MWPTTIATLVVGVVVLSSCTDVDPARPSEQGDRGAADHAPVDQARAADDAERASADREPGPRVIDGREHLALHVTADELELWRDRARNGPYRSDGDAGPNSPGDWERIAGNADEFMEDPEGAIWGGPDNDDGCVDRDIRHDPPTDPSTELRDAAFYALITDSDEHREAVADVLVAQSRVDNLDFTNRDRWCLGEIRDGHPSFMMSHWLSKLLFAYDYVGLGSFSADEREELEAWFHSAAEFFREEADASLDKLFANRAVGDYRLTDTARGHCDDTAYYGSEDICTLSRHYNNRRAGMYRFVALSGIAFDDADQQQSAKRFVEEFLRFGVFPEGYTVDFHRWTEELPDLGLNYGGILLGAVITIADHFARIGDTELYDLATSEGALGTEGGDKSIEFAVETFGRYLDHTIERYATADDDDVGDVDRLIDGIDDERHWVQDALLTPANVYYRNDYIRGLYTRRGPDMPRYPETPAANGPHLAWQGESGVYPGVLFMFGQREDLWPYPTDPR